MCGVMATNLHIDEKLLAKAVRIGQHQSKREAVNRALEEYIRYHDQQKITKLVGTIDFDPSYDYKAQRKRR